MNVCVPCAHSRHDQCSGLIGRRDSYPYGHQCCACDHRQGEQP